MSLLAITFPDVDSIAIQIGPVAIRWYGLAYVAGFILGWWLAKRLVGTARLWPRGTVPFDPRLLDNAIIWVVVAGILGGRLGFILAYNLGHYLANPVDIFATWKGGMSFHGGILGLVIGLWLFARKHRVSFLVMIDLAAVVAPIGIFFGRIANFVNGELWGRVTDVPWGVVFPDAGPEPRHPSQLYQAGLEGLLLFVVLFAIARAGGLRYPGFMAGCFGVGYGVARSIGELFRQPDSQLGFLFGGLTMGQLLSIPAVAAGLWLILRARRLTNF